MSETKKVLFVSVVYLPGKKAGGPIKSLSNLIQNIPNNIDPYVLTSNIDYPDNTVFENIQTKKWYQIGKAKVMYINPNEFNATFLKKFVYENNIDVIYFNSFFQNFTVKAYKFIKNEKQKKIIIATRGELSPSALSQKKIKKILFLFLYKLFLHKKSYYFHFTDRIEKNDFDIAIKKINNYYIIPNFVSKPEIFDIKKKESKVLKLVTIGRISPMKNILFSLKILKQCKNDIFFDIYGPLEDESYWEECRQVIKSLPNNIRVQYKGPIEPTKVFLAYSKYDAFFTPTLGENFGHAIFEGMSVGCIPIISDRTPWRNLEEKGIGWDISLENRDKFINIIDKLAMLKEQDFSIIKSKVIKFSKEKIYEFNDNSKLIEMFFE
ncbi:hypothetical protein OKS_03499 [Enterococcus faecium EnGen0047]|uniref:glycosyltransferase n=1 Tax=Enterococcus faecium TaxID=1352 RepID=UPI0002A33049|nr:glycosyltransferase [Enterococcus faecium]ELB61706.1 hypothetical protein OKS_03499 [Enterococcus faecium EnGen0047]